MLEEWSAAAMFVFAPASSGMIWGPCPSAGGSSPASGLLLKESASEALTAAATPFHYSVPGKPQVYCSVTRVETAAPCGPVGADAPVAGGRIWFSTTPDFLADGRDFQAKLRQMLLAVPWSYEGESAYITLTAVYAYTRAGDDVGA